MNRAVDVAGVIGPLAHPLGECQQEKYTGVSTPSTRVPDDAGRGAVVARWFAVSGDAAPRHRQNAAMMITLAGSFELSLPAERGIVHLTAGAEGSDRQAVAQQATDITEALRRQLVQLRDSGVATWYSVDAQTTASWRPHHNDGTVLPLHHRASTPVAVKFSDFAALSDSCARWAETAGLSIDRVDWALTTATRDRVRDEVLTGALHDAVHRAEVLASAAGQADPQVIAIADPGLLDRVSAGSDQPGPVAARALRGAAGGGSVELSPADITVASAVHVRFQV